MREADLETVRRLLGHTTYTIKQRYVRLNQGEGPAKDVGLHSSAEPASTEPRGSGLATANWNTLLSILTSDEPALSLYWTWIRHRFDRIILRDSSFRAGSLR